MSILVTNRDVSEIVSTPSLPSGPCPTRHRASATLSCRLLLITGGVTLDCAIPPSPYFLLLLRVFLAPSPRVLHFIFVGHPSGSLFLLCSSTLDPSMSAPPEGPSGAIPSLDVNAVPHGGDSSRQLELTSRPWATFPLFQKSQGAGESSLLIELVPASSPPGSRSVVSAVVRGLFPAGERDDPMTKWFGSPLELFAPLPVERPRYPWRRFACSRVAVGELLSHARLRPDLLRVRRV